MLFNKRQTATSMQTLTASLLRRSCSFFRAVSLSFSKGFWVIKACPTAGFGSSTSSKASDAAFVQTFSVRSASFLIGPRFSSVLHRFSGLKGKEAVELLHWQQSDYWRSLLNTRSFQEMLSPHFLPPVSSVLSHVPFLRRPYGNAGRHLWTTSLKPGRPTDWPVLPKSQHFLGQFPTQRFLGIISELQNDSGDDYFAFRLMLVCTPAATAARYNMHDFYFCRMVEHVQGGRDRKSGAKRKKK